MDSGDRPALLFVGFGIGGLVDYQHAFNFLVDVLEGDSGKPSRWGDVYGISPGYWKLYAKKKGIQASIPSRLDAFHFYKEEFWLPMGCENLPDGLDFCVFQWGVNHGPAEAIKDLQTCLGVTPDGIPRPETFSAARKCDDRKVMLMFLDRQDAWYEEDAKTNPSAPLRGWEGRVTKVKKIVGLI